MDEVLTYFRGWRPDWATITTGPLGRVVATDTAGKWLVRLDAWQGTSPSSGKVYEGSTFTELVEDGTPAFTVSGSARDLDVWLWNRPPLVAPAQDGSATDLARLAELVAAGVS